MRTITQTQYEKNNYVLNDKKYLMILTKIKVLEEHKLSETDNNAIKLIKTQLKKHWRTLLIIYLNKLIKRYKQ